MVVSPVRGTQVAFEKAVCSFRVRPGPVSLEFVIADLPQTKRRSRHQPRRPPSGRTARDPGEVRHLPASPVEEVRAEKWVPGGFVLSRTVEGEVILLRGSIPDEKIRARLQRKNKKVCLGAPLEILEPSTLRVLPDCPHFLVCGGCDWLHLQPEAHASAKQALALDALKRIGRLGPAALERVLPTQAADQPLRARRRVRVKVDAHGRPAFHALASHELVPIDPGCLAMHESLEATLSILAKERLLVPASTLQLAVDDRGHVSLALHGRHPEKTQRLCAKMVEQGCVSGAMAIVDDVLLGEYGDPVLRGEIAPGVAGGPYASDAATFTQATRLGGATILNAVCRAARESAQTLGTSCDHLRMVELFAGAGHLTLGLLQLGAAVHAVEGEPRAFAWLQKNVVQSGCSSRATLGRFFIDGPSVRDFLLDVDPPHILVVDPPRTGIVDFAGILAATAPESLVMVSCDPATGARDLRVAVENGYRLDWLLPIDAFPRTSHVEWVAKLLKDAP